LLFFFGYRLSNFDDWSLVCWWFLKVWGGVDCCCEGDEWMIIRLVKRVKLKWWRLRCVFMEILMVDGCLEMVSMAVMVMNEIGGNIEL
jgi:hypothetical protein